ncbi:MAG TPA: zinc-ribbon domain-containing protein [Humisphaera sp.]|jgi:curli biogenesis system outer membrane secretion channel CsgG|nr:zinc-ribbon domain-containing protein [Humisphaera sp.]
MLLLLPLLDSGCIIASNPPPKEGPQEVGHYPAPPVGVPRPRVAVAPFYVTLDKGFAKGVDLADASADEMLKLLDGTARFNLIERIRLAQMLREQNLLDVLEPGEWTHPAKLPGVSYVVIGRILNLSAAADDPAATFGMSKIQQTMGMGKDKNHRVTISVTANVDIRFVDPATGAPRIDLPRSYQRTADAATMGIDATDKDISPGAQLALNQNEAQTLVRTLLDEEIRLMLPQVDTLLQAQAAVPASLPATVPPMGQPIGTAPANAPKSGTIAERRICPECGADVSIYDEFCPNCGARLPRIFRAPTSQPVHSPSDLAR